MKNVVVAAVFFGLEIPLNRSIGARYTPPPIPVRPAIKPIKHPMRIICIMFTLTFARGFLETRVNKPEAAIISPITSLRMYSEIVRDSSPPMNDNGIEPTANKVNFFSRYFLHLVNDTPVLSILNNRLPIAAWDGAKPDSISIAKNIEPPPNPAMVYIITARLRMTAIKRMSRKSIILFV